MDSRTTSTEQTLGANTQPFPLGSLWTHHFLGELYMLIGVSEVPNHWDEYDLELVRIETGECSVGTYTAVKWGRCFIRIA